MNVLVLGLLTAIVKCASVCRLRRHLETDEPRSPLHVGPNTYRRFMDAFRELLTHKAAQRTRKVNKLRSVLLQTQAHSISTIVTNEQLELVSFRKALVTLDTTREEAEAMKQTIQSVQNSYEEAKEEVEKLLQQLVARATVRRCSVHTGSLLSSIGLIFNTE